MVAISRAEYENMQAQIQWLMEQLRLSRQKRFGASSERTSEDAMEQPSLLFNEAEVYADRAEKEDDSSSLPDEITVVGRWAHARRKFDEAMKSLPKGEARNSSATENGLDPYRYLTWLLSSAAELELVQPDAVQTLLPWNALAPCKA